MSNNKNFLPFPDPKGSEENLPTTKQQQMSDNSNNMHYGAFSETFRLAKMLRKNMTEAEILLWNELKSNKLDGYKFRRQHPIGRFIVDFYCHKAKLVIELDGEIHQEPDVAENDINREKEITDLGIRVLRFSNTDIKNKMKRTLDRICKELSQTNVTLQGQGKDIGLRLRN